MISLTTMARAAGRLFPPRTPLGLALRRIKWRLGGRPISRGAGLLKALAQSQRETRFVQIGANDGVTDDPLHYFIVNYGWRGILVEPVPRLFERLKRTYARCPGLIFENVAISTREGLHDFYDVADPAEPGHGLPPWYAGLGSLSCEVVLGHAREYPAIKRYLRVQQVACVTFESLCARHALSTLDLIAIDAEGHDFEILGLIDFSRYRPLVLVYEHLHMTPAQRDEIGARLAAEGFEFFEEALNTFCLNTRRLGPAQRCLGDAWNKP